MPIPRYDKSAEAGKGDRAPQVCPSLLPVSEQQSKMQLLLLPPCWVTPERRHVHALLMDASQPGDAHNMGVAQRYENTALPFPQETWPRCCWRAVAGSQLEGLRRHIDAQPVKLTAPSFPQETWPRARGWLDVVLFQGWMLAHTRS